MGGVSIIIRIIVCWVYIGVSLFMKKPNFAPPGISSVPGVWEYRVVQDFFSPGRVDLWAK